MTPSLKKKKKLFLKIISVPGVDETVVVVMRFSRNRMAVCAFSIGARFANDAVISGTEGSLKVVLQVLQAGPWPQDHF